MQQDEIPAPSEVRPALAIKLRRASAAMFVICLFLPAYTIAYYSSPHTTFGWQALLLGPLGILDGHLSWYANPLFMIAWKKCANPTTRETAYGLALLAFGIAFLFLLGSKMTEGSAGTFPYHAGIGFYAWLVSIGLTVASASIGNTTMDEVGSQR